MEIHEWFYIISSIQHIPHAMTLLVLEALLHVMSQRLTPEQFSITFVTRSLIWNLLLKFLFLFPLFSHHFWYTEHWDGCQLPVKLTILSIVNVKALLLDVTFIFCDLIIYSITGFRITTWPLEMPISILYWRLKRLPFPKIGVQWTGMICIYMYGIIITQIKVDLYP